jgi:hypothetical protein
MSETLIMTQAEEKAELGSLRARLSQLEQEQEWRKQEWHRLRYAIRAVALGFAITGLVMELFSFFVGGAKFNSNGFPFILTSIPLVFLAQALGDRPTRS